MLRKLREARENEEGFTLIELLVVVIIIGILAAIAIPVFLNQREGAYRSAAESDARNAAIAVETYFTELNAYPTGPATWAGGTTGAEFDIDGDGSNDVTVSENVTLEYAVTGNIYTITASHTQLGASQVVYNSSTGGLGQWS